MEIPIKIIQASKSDLPEIEALQASSFPIEKQATFPYLRRKYP